MTVSLVLKVFKDDQLVITKRFERDIIKIGRLASAHLTIDDEKVARIHAVLDVDSSGALSLTDMGTAEGTILNGKRIMKASVRFGDTILIGGIRILVEADTGQSEVTASGVGPPGVITAAETPAPAAAPAPPPPPAQAVGPAAVAVAVAPPPPPAQAYAVAQPPPPPLPAVPQAARFPVEETGESSLDVRDEATGELVRERPRRRARSGPMGVELRFLWGDSIVGEFFLPPDVDQAFRVGSEVGVNFTMGDSKLGGPSFHLLRVDHGNVTLRFNSKMNGELHRRSGEEVIPLEGARKAGVAQPDGDALSLALSADDFAWVDLGGIVVEVFFQPKPKPVFVPFAETVDFTVLNIFLLMFFFASLFVISAANLSAEGDELADDLSASTARMAKLLIRPPEPVKLKTFERLKKKGDTGEAAAKHKGDEGQMGKKDAPARSARAAPKGDPNNKDQARALVAKVFGGSGGGISTIFGKQGLGGELKSAMGNMFGAAAGDAAGFGGLGLRGSASGGGGTADSIGIGVNTKGRGGGTGAYGSGVALGEGRKDYDVGITQSDPTVVGSLDKELIRKVIHQNRGQVRACYESQLIRYPKLSGKVSVKFVITADGTVSTSSVAQSTAGNPELENCVASRVRGWVFPKPKGGGVVVVTYPFLFQQAGGG